MSTLLSFIHPRMISFLRNFLNYYPRTIIDVGAHIGIWGTYARFVYPHSNILMIEANANCEENLKSTGINYELSLVGEENSEERTFYKLDFKNSPGNSQCLENTKKYKEGNYREEKIPMRTLDEILERRSIEDVDFIKLDIGGSEMDTLIGASKTLAKGVEFILIETQLFHYNQSSPLFSTLVDFMESKDYEIFDIWKLHYESWQQCLCSSDTSCLSKVDVLFIHKKSPHRKQCLEKIGITSIEPIYNKCVLNTVIDKTFEENIKARDQYLADNRV